jgi:putative endonuclease
MDDRFYFTYIIASKSRTLYIGVTGDLHRRIFQHKQKTHRGFTARYNCNRLVWFESFREVSAAIQREKEIKGWTRARKIALIEAGNRT